MRVGGESMAAPAAPTKVSNTNNRLQRDARYISSQTGCVKQVSTSQLQHTLHASCCCGLTWSAKARNSGFSRATLSAWKEDGSGQGRGLWDMHGDLLKRGLTGHLFYVQYLVMSYVVQTQDHQTAADRHTVQKTAGCITAKAHVSTISCILVRPLRQMHTSDHITRPS
jgi:hypothetical protein